ncbi:MAG: cyclase family protein [Pseudonocardia sp.]|nr:cyclase family protein [Pseudonocardia sp.]
MTPHAYDGNGGRSPRWWPSRYGSDDRIGAANELTDERALAALGLPREGRVVELGRLLEPGVPAYPPRTWSQLMLAHQSLIQWSPTGSQMTAFEEQVSQTYQIGTHLDGLGHVGVDGRFYNGLHYEDFFAPTGLTELGIETAKPWVSRGVFLDIAGLEDERVLPAGFVIEPAHLEA